MLKERLLEADGPVLNHLGELGHTTVEQLLVINLRILNDLPKVHTDLIAEIAELAATA